MTTPRRGIPYVPRNKGQLAYARSQRASRGPAYARWLLHGALALLMLVAVLGVPRATPEVGAAQPVRVTPAQPPAPAPASGLTLAPEPLAKSGTMRETRVAGRGFSYCANGSLDNPDPAVKRVIFIMHGNDRQACAMVAAVLAAGTPQQRAETLVVSPRFPIREDKINPNTQLYWSFAAWSQGDMSANDDVRISSYAVLDELRNRVQEIPTVVAGFSGGGQFVARYAAGTPQAPLRFVITNPSSYLYWTPERPGTALGQLTFCPSYDDYRYGVKRLNPYMAAVGAPTLQQRFGERQVVYLLGDADNDPRSTSMDRTCGALAQGANRFERGQRYWAYLPTVFGSEIQTRHRLIVVPKVSHNAYAMFQDPKARSALYD